MDGSEWRESSRLTHPSRRTWIAAGLCIALLGMMMTLVFWDSHDKVPRSGHNRFEAKYEEHGKSLRDCTAYLLKDPHCRQPWALCIAFAVAVLFLLVLLELFCFCGRGHTAQSPGCCCCRGGPTESPAYQLLKGREELQSLLEKHTISYNDYKWQNGDPQEDIEKKMMKAWNAADREDNLVILEEVARIMKVYPSLSLHLKGISSGKGQNNHVTESAFSKDFASHFPQEGMDKREPYAHGRTLSIKRLLGRQGVPYSRMTTSIEIGPRSQVILTLD